MQGWESQVSLEDCITNAGGRCFDQGRDKWMFSREVEPSQITCSFHRRGNYVLTCWWDSSGQGARPVGRGNERQNEKKMVWIIVHTKSVMKLYVLQNWKAITTEQPWFWSFCRCSCAPFKEDNVSAVTNSNSEFEMCVCERLSARFSAPQWISHQGNSRYTYSSMLHLSL